MHGDVRRINLPPMAHKEVHAMIYEVMNDALRGAIAARLPMDQMKAIAQRAGLRPLRSAALALVASGATSLEEANRVTFVD